MTKEEALKQLQLFGSKKNIEGMKRFNIYCTKTFGVSAPNIRLLAKQIKTDHLLALQLWDSENHDARILATLLADPLSANLTQLDQWANDIENWAQCDACCTEYFRKTKYAESLPYRWTINKKEFVRRAGLVLIASMAVHHKEKDDDFFIQYFPLIKQYSTDERNFVKKGVNWVLRQIGKRNMRLHKKAILLAKEINQFSSKSAKWIACDAINELTNHKTIENIKKRML